MTSAHIFDLVNEVKRLQGIIHENAHNSTTAMLELLKDKARLDSRMIELDAYDADYEVCRPRLFCGENLREAIDKAMENNK